MDAAAKSHQEGPSQLQHVSSRAAKRQKQQAKQRRALLRIPAFTTQQQAGEKNSATAYDALDKALGNIKDAYPLEHAYLVDEIRHLKQSELFALGGKHRAEESLRNTRAILEQSTAGQSQSSLQAAASSSSAHEASQQLARVTQDLTKVTKNLHEAHCELQRLTHLYGLSHQHAAYAHQELLQHGIQDKWWDDYQASQAQSINVSAPHDQQGGLDDRPAP